MLCHRWVGGNLLIAGFREVHLLDTNEVELRRLVVIVAALSEIY